MHKKHLNKIQEFKVEIKGIKGSYLRIIAPQAPLNRNCCLKSPEIESQVDGKKQRETKKEEERKQMKKKWKEKKRKKESKWRKEKKRATLLNKRIGWGTCFWKAKINWQIAD